MEQHEPEWSTYVHELREAMPAKRRRIMDHLMGLSVEAQVAGDTATQHAALDAYSALMVVESVAD